jgi:guanylate kinase
MENNNRHCILIVGPSGSGKSTLENDLVNLFPDMFYKTVSLTTRKPRANEVDGIHYHYVDEEEFNSIQKVESIEFLGIKYGLAETEFTGTDKNLVCVVEPTGCGQIINYISENFPTIKLVLVYFDIPDDIRYNNMLTGRGDDILKIKDRMEKDKIKDQFEERQIEFVSKVHYYRKITYLTDHLHFNVMSMLYGVHTHAYHLNIPDQSSLSRDSGIDTWSVWDEDTKSEIDSSQIIFAGPDRVICQIYGKVRVKYKPKRDLYLNQIDMYFKKFVKKEY